VAALAQNGDSLGTDQAGAADDDDLHGSTSLVDDWRRPNRFECAPWDLPEQAKICSVALFIADLGP
jgi:hypothetical protein